MLCVYKANELLFNNNGIKVLHPIFAEITKKYNSDYYLELEDVLDNFEYYQKGLIIRVDTPWGKQGFRCDKPIIKNDRVTCKAWHLFYDSKNYIVKDAYSVDKNCNDALNHFNNSTDRPSPFTTFSDISKISTSRMVTKTLFEIFVDLISDDLYGGYWYRDNWTFGIKSKNHVFSGINLAYKKNISNFEAYENWDDVCTKILPYTTDGDKRIYLDNTFLYSENPYDIDYPKIIRFDNPYNKNDYDDYSVFLSDTKTWLRNVALDYLDKHRYPFYSLSFSSTIKNVGDVGDLVYIKHPKCNVDYYTIVVGIKYDCISQKYTKIDFDNSKKEIKNLQNQIANEIKKSTEENNILLQNELNQATSKFNDMLSNSYKIIEEDKIMFVDKLPKEDAKYVLKISNGGIGFSSTGINGVFTSAWTLDGTLNMNAINVINLSASLIKGGVLKLGGLNNSSGTFELYDELGNLICLEDKDGLTCFAKNGDYVKLNAYVGFAGFNKNDIKTFWADGDVFHMKNAEIENELQLANIIKFVPVNTSTNKGIGIVAISN